MLPECLKGMKSIHHEYSITMLVVVKSVLTAQSFHGQEGVKKTLLIDLYPILQIIPLETLM